MVQYRPGYDPNLGPESLLLSATQDFIKQLYQEPFAPYDCSFDGSPAVSLVEMSAGCVAMKDQVQLLCPQHHISRQPLDEELFVVDFSLDGKWADYRRERSLYFITKGAGLVLAKTVLKNY